MPIAVSTVTKSHPRPVGISATRSVTPQSSTPQHLGDATVACSSMSTEGFERVSEVGHDQVGFLHCGEVSSAFELDPPYYVVGLFGDPSDG